MEKLLGAGFRQPATFYSSLEREISGYPGTAETVEIRVWQGQLLNSHRVADAVAIAVPYQTISPTSHRRSLDKPHNGRSLRRGWLRYHLTTKGNLGGQPGHDNIPCYSRHRH